MNIRLTKNIPQMIGGVIILTILMCVGMFLYVRWDLKHFKQSLREPPKVSPVTTSQKKEMKNTHVGEPRAAETTLEPLTHYEEQAERDNGRGFTGLISALESRNDIGESNSQDVAIVIETLKRASKGPLAVDDLITMMEAWLRIQPNNPQEKMEINETRDFLTNMLSHLRTDREEFLQGGKETKYSLRIYQNPKGQKR